MSGDEYDDELSDDELEERLKSPAKEAYDRLRARERPTEDDVKLGEPFYKKLADQDKIPFLMVSGGFYIGFNGVLYPYYLGGDYVRLILQNNTRTFPHDRPLSINELVSGGCLGPGGLRYYPDPPDPHQAYSESYDENSNWEAPYQHSEFEEVMEPNEMRLYVAEAKKLKVKVQAGEATAKEIELLAYLNKQLGEDTHQGNIKSIDPEEEKRRQTVYHDIRNFYEKLEGEKYGTDESRRIMRYFRKHIRTAHGCYCYTGPWEFKFS